MKAPFADNEIVRGKAWTWVVLCALAACAAPAVPAPRPASRETPDQAAVRVIGYSRRFARIVRPWSAVTDTRSSGGVPIALAGSPGAELALDRDYWAVVVTGRDRWPLVSWVLGSKDEQSGLEITVSAPYPINDALLDDASRSRGPSPPRQMGNVGGQAVEWSRWSDYGELYSDCTVGLAGYEVTVTVTAKTEARRRALEERLASLQLFRSAPPSGGGPKN